MVERLNRELTLTADQQKKIKAIYEKAFQGAGQASSNGATGAAARRQRMQQQNNAQNDFRKRFEQTNAEIKKVLTPEQQKKFDAMPRFGNGRGMGMNVDQRIARMDERLKLSAAQKAKLKTIMERQSQEMQKMFQQRQQQGGQQNGNWQAMQAEGEKIRAKNQKEIESVLTPAQQKQYQAMQEEQRQRMQQRMQQGGGGNQR
jgi:Spy/CpxP family protein refolding chaperone